MPDEIFLKSEGGDTELLWGAGGVHYYYFFKDEMMSYTIKSSLLLFPGSNWRVVSVSLIPREVSYLVLGAVLLYIPYFLELLLLRESPVELFPLLLLALVLFLFL